MPSTQRVLCVGGRCKGQYADVPSGLHHGALWYVAVEVPMLAMGYEEGSTPFTSVIESETYKLGKYYADGVEVWVLHPVHWDGMNVLSHLLTVYRNSLKEPGNGV